MASPGSLPGTGVGIQSTKKLSIGGGGNQAHAS